MKENRPVRKPKITFLILPLRLGMLVISSDELCTLEIVTVSGDERENLFPLTFTLELRDASLISLLGFLQKRTYYLFLHSLAWWSFWRLH